MEMKYRETRFMVTEIEEVQIDTETTVVLLDTIEGGKIELELCNYQLLNMLGSRTIAKVKDKLIKGIQKK